MEVNILMVNDERGVMYVEYERLRREMLHRAVIIKRGLSSSVHGEPMKVHLTEAGKEKDPDG